MHRSKPRATSSPKVIQSYPRSVALWAMLYTHCVHLAGYLSPLTNGSMLKVGCGNLLPPFRQMSWYMPCRTQQKKNRGKASQHHNGAGTEHGIASNCVAAYLNRLDSNTSYAKQAKQAMLETILCAGCWTPNRKAGKSQGGQHYS